MTQSQFKPDTCSCCGQKLNYLLSLNKGSAKIVAFMLEAVRRKGKNDIHVSSELKPFGSVHNFVCNMSRPRYHGLVAFTGDQRGHYCLTRKGGSFLRGEAVPKHAIINMVTGHQDGYWRPEEETVTIGELMQKQFNWDDGQSEVIERLDPQDKQASLLGL